MPAPCPSAPFILQPVPGTLVVESVARRGLAVERGPDWRWTEQDGGTGSVGVMVAPSTGFPGWWNVKWANGNDKYRYRIGAEGAYDLKVGCCAPRKLAGSDGRTNGCLGFLRVSASVA